MESKASSNCCFLQLSLHVVVLQVLLQSKERGLGWPHGKFCLSLSTKVVDKKSAWCAEGRSGVQSHSLARRCGKVKTELSLKEELHDSGVILQGSGENNGTLQKVLFRIRTN